MKSELTGLLRSFAYAWAGVRHCIRCERNFRIHLSAAAWALALAWYLGVEGLRLAVLLLTIALVLVLELLNTAMEAFVDLVSPGRHPLAKVAKDAAAGAVLIAAAISVGVGFCLLWQPRRLLALAGLALQNAHGLLILLALAALATALFIFSGKDKKQLPGEKAAADMEND